MAKKKRKINRFGPMTMEERLKYEIAEELGLLPKIVDRGWAGLTSAESGKVGGMVRVRLLQTRSETIRV